MTMNLPPQYNRPQPYQQQQFQPYSNPNFPQRVNPRYVSPQNIPQQFVNRSHSPLVPPQQSMNRGYSPINPPQVYAPQQNVSGVSPQVIRQPYGRQNVYSQGAFGVPVRENNFVRGPGNMMPQMYGQRPPVYEPNLYPYQQPNVPFQGYSNMPNIPQNITGQQYSSPYSPQVPQTYAPLFTSSGLANYNSVNNLVYNQMKRNIPEQSLNSNFSYQNANFDCDYSVQENLVHCVICNQTYKTNQKKQHLELHREKARNINIRPVDEKQLQRLQKYNAMTKKGLVVKPIVEPEEFNVQYNPNQFVLKKVTQYRNVDGPLTNEIQIQTQDPSHGQFYQSNRQAQQSSMRRSEQSSPQRSSPNRTSQFKPVNPENNRITNTRFNNDSVREEEAIFLSDRFDHHEGDNFKPYNEQNSFRESERRSNYAGTSRASEAQKNPQSYGYDESPNLKYRNAESINRPEDLGYQKGNALHDINEAEQYRESNRNEIPIDQIVNDVVHRASQY